MLQERITFILDNWEKEQYPFSSLGFGKWELLLPADKAPKHESILKVGIEFENFCKQRNWYRLISLVQTKLIMP